MPPRPLAWLDVRYRYVVMIASLLMLTIGSGGTFILVVALKHIAQDFGWPRTIPSLGYSLQYFGGGLGGIALGYALDKVGAALPAHLAAVMVGSGALLMSGFEHPWQLFLIYGFMFGFMGHGALISPLTANILRWFDRRRGMAIGIVMAGQTLSGTIWPPIAWYFIEHHGWRQTYFLYGCFALATMLPLSLVFRRRPPELPAPVLPPLPDAPAKRPPLSPLLLQSTLCAGIYLCCVAMSLPLAHVVSHTNDLGHPMTRAAEMLAIMLLASTVGRMFVLGPVTDRLGGIRGLLVFSSAQAAALAMFLHVDGLIGLYILSAAFGLGYSGVIPCYSVILREYLPLREVGRRNGLLTLFGGLGMASGGWLGGFVFDMVQGYPLAFAIGLGFNIVNILVVLALWRRMRGQAAA